MSYFKPSNHYICAVPQGRHIDGSPRKAIPALVTGKLARRDLLEEWDARTMGALPYHETRPWKFRLSDGRLPEFQERTDIAGAQRFLRAHPMNPAYLVYPAFEIAGAEQEQRG